MQPIKKENFSIAVNKDNAEAIFLALVGLGYHGYDYATISLTNRDFVLSENFSKLYYNGHDVCRARTEGRYHFETFSAFLDWHFDKQEKTEAEKELDKLQKQIKMLQEQADILQTKLK